MRGSAKTLFLATGLLGGALVNFALAIRWIDVARGLSVCIFEPCKAIAVMEAAGFFWLGLCAFISFVELIKQNNDERRRKERTGKNGKRENRG